VASEGGGQYWWYWRGRPELGKTVGKNWMLWGWLGWGVPALERFTLVARDRLRFGLPSSSSGVRESNEEAAITLAVPLGAGPSSKVLIRPPSIALIVAKLYTGAMGPLLMMRPEVLISPEGRMIVWPGRRDWAAAVVVVLEA